MKRLSADFLPFLRFGLSGFPAFLLAVAANIFLVGKLHWPKPAAYALVIWMQMSSGFIMCRYLVFAEGREVPLLRAYAQFIASMAAIRFADWCVYTLLVELLTIPYVIAQIATMALFIGIKFLFAKHIFTKKST